MTRREVLAAMAASPAIAAKKEPPRAKPNILLVMADDLASWMLGCYGNKEIRTPNIDRLAQSGMRFTNHFVSTPICSASRATFFTGRLPRQHGIHDFLTDQPIEQPPQGQKDIPSAFASEVMISDVLQQAGYRCGYVGKWHMGSDTKPGHGHEYTCTFNGGSSPYQNPRLFVNGEPRDEQGYLTEILTQRADDFLGKQDARPFFLTLSHFNPHTPYSGHPQKYYDLYKDTNFESFGWEPMAPHALREKELMKDVIGNLRRCAASVTALDDQVGAIWKKLAERKLVDNTLIVFTGDNGFLLGRHGLWSKGLASDPINMYEEVVQTPLLMSWPGKIPVQSSRSELIASYDLMPTLCEAAQATPPSRNLCGSSYLAMAQGKIFGKKDKPWRPTVFGHFRNTEMARDNRFKLVLRDGGEGPSELFDLSSDPRERTNHYANPQYVTVRDRLAKDLAAWRTAYSA